MNAPAAIAQLALVAAAVKRLQDAQGAENVAQAKLTDLQNKGNASAGQLAAAQERLEKAHRATAAATIQLANAHDMNDRAMRKASDDADKLTAKTKETANQFKVGLIPALLAVSPAAVPIAGVAVGALLGLTPAAATAILGVKGITQEFKSGALVGTQYQTDIQSLINELGNLKQTAADGLLGGVDQAIQGSQPLFGTLNSDIGMMSNQLGSIVAGAGPALLAILNALNPLFITFGQLLSDGAQHLEHWATSSTGIQSFVAYVQAELPTVMTTLGSLVSTLSHVVEGAAPFGGVLLSDINFFVTALSKIPVGAWAAMIPVAVSLYTAFKAYQGITAIVNGLSLAVSAMKAPFATTAEAATAASLATQSAAADAAAVVAMADAEMAAAAAESATAIAAAAEEAGAADVALSQLIAENAIEQAAAFQTTADAAVASAAEIATAAEEAAAASTAASEAASIGWAGMLGPIGAVVIGVGLLTTMFLHSSDATKGDTAAVNDYTQALIRSKGAIDANVRSSVANQLTQDGLLEKARQAGVSLSTLTDDVLGNSDAHTQVTASINKTLDALYNEYLAGTISEGSYAKQHDALFKLNDQINSQVSAFSKSVQAQRDYAAANQASDTSVLTLQAATMKYTTAVQNALTAVLALGNAQLAQAQSVNAFREGILNMSATVKQNGTSMADNTTKGLANRDMLLQLLTQAKSIADAQSKNHVATKTVTQDLADNVAALEAQAVKLGLSKSAVQDLVTQMGLTPAMITTTFNAKTSAAATALAKIKAQMDAFHDITVTATVKANLGNTYNSQVPGRAGGGTIDDGPSGTVPGSGSGATDTHLVPLADGEEVIKASAARKHRALLKAINNGEGLATGGTVGKITTGTSGGKEVWIYNGTQYTSERAAQNAQIAAQKSEDKKDAATRTKISGSDTRGLYSSLSGSASQISSAIAALMADTSKLDAPKSLTNMLKLDNTKLQTEANARVKVAAQLAQAQTALNNAVQKFNTERSSVAGAALGTFNISSAGTPLPTSTGFASGVAGVSTTIAGSTAIGVSSIIAQLTLAASNAKKFDQLLHSLAKKGLGQTLLDQLAQAGPAALAQAQALDAATSGQIKQINSQESALGKSANDAGTFMAKLLDGAGVSAAQGLVNGLKSKEKDIAAVMKTLADTMVKTIKKELGIHSPSLVMHQLGQFTGQGFAHGIGSQAMFVRSQSMRLAGAAVPSITRPGVGSNSSGLSMVQHIYPQAGQSEMQIAKASASEIVWALRR